MARKRRSIAKLKREAVPTMAQLPLLPDSTEVKRRTCEEVAQRAIALCMVAIKGEGIESEILNVIIEKFGAKRFMSPAEMKFIENDDPTAQDRINFTWHYECLWVLLWALGYIKRLERPDAICEARKAVSFFLDLDPAKFIRESRLRDLTKLLDQADLIYRYDWAVVDARVKGQDSPAALDGGVVRERHYAFNWLMGCMDQEWDDIRTDT